MLYLSCRNNANKQKAVTEMKKLESMNLDFVQPSSGLANLVRFEAVKMDYSLTVILPSYTAE